MPNSSEFQPTVCYDLTATIASGQTTSGEIDLHGTSLAGVIMPSAFTGANLGVQVSNVSGGTFSTLTDGAGNTFELPVAASKSGSHLESSIARSVEYHQTGQRSNRGREPVDHSRATLPL